jgi:hypothetical protein
MLAAFILVAAYLGFADLGSRMMDPPPKPARALLAPNPAAPSVAVASGSAEADTARPADR